MLVGDLQNSDRQEELPNDHVGYSRKQGRGEKQRPDRTCVTEGWLGNERGAIQSPGETHLPIGDWQGGRGALRDQRSWEPPGVPPPTWPQRAFLDPRLDFLSLVALVTLWNTLWPPAPPAPKQYRIPFPQKALLIFKGPLCLHRSCGSKRM